MFILEKLFVCKMVYWENMKASLKAEVPQEGTISLVFIATKL